VVKNEGERRKVEGGRMKFSALSWRSLGVVLLWQFLIASSVHAQVEPFYKGKQIRIITGATAGGFYDRWGRLLAKTMPK